MLRIFFPDNSSLEISGSDTSLAGVSSSGADSETGSGSGRGVVCETGGATRGLINGLRPALSEVFFTFLTGSSKSTVGP